MGFINPLLYRIQYEDSEMTWGKEPPPAQERAFRDITAGNTDVVVRTLQRNHEGSFKAFMRRIPGFEAEPRWDPVTGLGVPRLAHLMARVLTPAYLGLEVAPELDLTGRMFLFTQGAAAAASPGKPGG
ncbi:MAG: hypothetical protein R3F43_28140 [bacterium]